MPPLLTHLLLLSIVLYSLVVIVDIVRKPNWRLLTEGLGIIAAFLLLRWSTGFPTVRESFSSLPSVVSVVAMYAFVLLGMAATYFFYLRKEFAWMSFIRPFLVSPIVLLPLIGTVDNRVDVESTQAICLAILAFQNGFFWRTVFDHAQRRTK
jgi:hypothetical protein